MIHAAGPSDRRIPRGWLLPVGGLVPVLIAIAAGFISRAIVIDFLAWWPVWLTLGIVAFVARGRKWSGVNLDALVPVVMLAALGVFVWGYFAGWEAMPSAVNRLNGPEEGPATVAALSTDIDGRLVVGTSDLGFLYTVTSLRGGGEVGLPEASEQTQGSAVAIALTPVADAGLYTFSGWDIGLSPVPIWNLSLSGEVDADVSGLVLTELQLDGSGSAVLGSPPTDAVASISGEFELTIAAGVSVTVVGTADVPESWVETGDGWASPGEGPGWVITVEDGSTLSIEES